jgi:5S rRNA maturation endonuclease (ribonuclease M5)
MKQNLFEDDEEQLKLKEGIAKFRGCSLAKMLSFPSKQMRTKEHVDQFQGHSLYKLFFDHRVGSLVYGRLLIPISTPAKFYISYVAYDVLAQIHTKQTGEKKPAYFAPISERKDSIVFVPENSWERVTNSNTIYLVDGVFDSITVNYLGLPAMALLGSRISEDISKILSLYERIILVQDNDQAGSNLFIELSKRFRNVARVKIPASIAKDIDEFHNKTSDEEAHNLLKRGENYESNN